MRSAALTSFLALLVASFAASAAEPTGLSARSLYEACRHTVEKLEEGPEALSDPKLIHTCFYYVMGAADMAASMSPSPIYGGQICVPRDYAFQDVARKIVALGVQLPDLFSKDNPASLLAYYAVKETYGQREPCAKADVAE